MLERQGCLVDVVDNGQDAINKVKQNIIPYDIIFMDVQMPEM